jgi:uncharacterized membrane protein
LRPRLALHRTRRRGRAFFLGFVLVAAIFGAATSKRSILFIQGAPAALALLTVITDVAR